MPGDILEDLAKRVRARRKEHHMTQVALAQKSAVSLASLRRFEQQYEINLTSLVRIAFALGCEQDFNALFSTPYYRTLDDVAEAAKKTGKSRA